MRNILKNLSVNANFVVIMGIYDVFEVQIRVLLRLGLKLGTSINFNRKLKIFLNLKCIVVTLLSNLPCLLVLCGRFCERNSGKGLI